MLHEATIRIDNAARGDSPAALSALRGGINEVDKIKSAEIVLAIITAAITVTKAAMKFVDHIKKQRKNNNALY